jgi:DNA-binding GntR family transcriptional regulator
MTAFASAKSKAQSSGEVERVYHLLKGWLIDAKLAPGEVLSEVELASRCRTSRTPVRESFSRLAQDGWLRRIPRKGYLVAPISIRDVVELYEYRKVLECFAAERVAQAAGPQAVEELAEIVAIEKEGESHFAEILAANGRFHLRLAELASNARVTSQVALVLCYVKRLDTICTQSVPGWIGHQEIIDALRERQPEAARQAMARHIDLSRDKMLRLFAAWPDLTAANPYPH